MKQMMKRWILGICSLLACVQLRAADHEWLFRLQQAVQRMGAYEVQFDLETSDGYAVSGTYRVAGEHYWIELPEMRVYSDGKARYEINDKAREVVIDAVDTQSRNLLDNPAHAFDFMGEQYAAETLTEQAERITLRLTPRNIVAQTSIDLVLEKRTALPAAVTYASGDVQIAVRIRSIQKRDQPLPSFGKSDVPGYEWIDFR